MKTTCVALLTASLLSMSLISAAQPIAVKQAIVYSTLTPILPEEDDMSDRGGRGGFRDMMGAEIKLTTYTKNDQSKTIMKSDFMNSSVYRDNIKNSSTTIMEIMGQKMGFYSDEKEVAKMQQARENQGKGNKDLSNIEVEISVTGETAKMAGYNCKKAYMITKRAFGQMDTAIVWFTPEIKLESHLTGMSGGNMGMMQGMDRIIKKMDKIEGFVTGYELKMNRGRSMKMEVTKIDLKTTIDEKEFQIPKNIEVKPISEMRNMFGGMMRGNGQ